MNLLLDTYALLWFIDGNPHLRPAVRAAFEDADNRLLVSLASLWEIGIKRSQGRVRLPDNGLDFVVNFLNTWSMELLPIRLNHLRAASDLPFHHGDPFDRMLIAQAKVEGLRLVSGDRKIGSYDVAIFW